MGAYKDQLGDVPFAPLEPRALSRSNDPGTSHTAARSMDAALPDLEKRVFASIIESGTYGCTLDDLTLALGLDKVTVSPRLRPLANKGLIVEAENKRPGISGRPQTVWRGK